MRPALILAVALIVTCGANAQQRQRTSQQPPNPPQQQQAAPDNRGTEQVPFVVKEIPRERTAEERKEAQEKSELDRKLTGYTSELATDTERLFGATLLLAALTGALAIAAFLQMREGRKAIKAAQDAAKAAAESAKATAEQAAHTDRLANSASENAQRQLRAYVMLDADVQLLVDGDGQIEAVLTVKNFGPTPARDVTQWNAVGVFTLYELHEVGAPPGPMPERSRHVLPPYGWSKILGRISESLSPEEVHEIGTGNLELYIWGRIDYTDAFDQPRFTEYRLRSMGDAFINRRTMFTEEGNRYT